MKCKDPNCHRSVKIPGEKYCSELCAHAGLASTGSRFPSMVMDTSITQGHGETYQESSDDESTIGEEQKPLKPGQRRPEQPKSVITRTTPNPWLTADRSGEKKLKEQRAMSTGRETEKGALPSLLRSGLEQQSQLSREVQLESMSLIQNSVNQLHGLMKDVGAAIKAHPHQRVDPQLVNAACNCAKQMGQLMKLQMDYLKSRK